MAKFLSKINSPDYIENRILKIDSDENLIPSALTVSEYDNNQISISLADGNVSQRILITDDATSNTNVYNFQQKNNPSQEYQDLMVIKDNGHVVANVFEGNLNGNANSSTQVKVTETSPATATSYNLLFTLAGNTANTDLRINNIDAKMVILEGSTNTIGSNVIYLGNNIAKGNAGNKYGGLVLYSNGSGYNNLVATESNENVSNFLPAVSGTLLNSANYNRYALPLTGGTITGNLIVNGTIEGKTTITADTDLITKSGIVNLNDNALIQYNETDECIEFVFP